MIYYLIYFSLHFFLVVQHFKMNKNESQRFDIFLIIIFTLEKMIAKMIAFGFHVKSGFDFHLIPESNNSVANYNAQDWQFKVSLFFRGNKILLEMKLDWRWSFLIHLQLFLEFITKIELHLIYTFIYLLHLMGFDTFHLCFAYNFILLFHLKMKIIILFRFKIDRDSVIPWFLNCKSNQSMSYFSIEHVKEKEGNFSRKKGQNIQMLFALFT